VAWGAKAIYENRLQRRATGGDGMNEGGAAWKPQTHGGDEEKSVYERTLGWEKVFGGGAEG